MRKLIWMLAALLTLAPAAFAQTAQEMTDRCAFSSVGKKTLDRMTDGDYRTYWASSSNGSAYVEIEAEDAIGGVYVQFYDDASALDVQTRDASGVWQTVAQTDGALLYHCTAGKDRVGVGTMLLLTALGVDWPVIVENYLITNERMAASTDCLLTAVVDYDLSEAEREVIRTFDRADAAFLTAARDAVAERYGSVDAFLTQALGVGAAERAALRARYLTAE